MTKWIIEKTDGGIIGLPTKEVKPQHLRHISQTAWRILQELSREPNYPKALARKLRLHEQKIYYHIRNLKKAGLIRVVRQENIGGIIANYYGLDKPAFTIKLQEPKPIRNLKTMKKEHENFLRPFVEDGQFNALFVVGSTEPHGTHRAKAEDATHGIAMALLFGSFLNIVNDYHVKWDTEITKGDLNRNIILIGGPAINSVVSKINNKLPIRFVKKGEVYYSIYSTISKKHYTSENIGVIVKAKNPFNKDKYVLVIAGRRYSGTRAAVISLIKNLDEIANGNRHNPNVHAKVVDGIDLDSDGQVDSIDIKE